MTTHRPLWLTSDVSPAQVDELVNALGLPTRVGRWLVARGISTPDTARRFLYAREQFTDPFDFDDMRLAVDRIRKAVQLGEHIVIVGDYDVDGVTASAILASELTCMGAEFTCLIPERIADGYGLSESLVDKAMERGGKLIVTVDNGIRAAEAIAKATVSGIDVIITDHHEPGDTTLPACVAVVHPARHANPQEANVLSGAGVAWKLSQALGRGRESAQSQSDHDEWQFGLAALGAISDLMPMRGENRRLIREGLDALRHCRRPGWLALCERARVNVDELSVTSVSWRIGPRLNAAGRMAHADVAYELLMSTKRAAASELADGIEELNTARRQCTEDASAEAMIQAEQLYGEQPRGIVVAGDWPLGIVGIVAAKLVTQFGCPAIVLSDTGNPVLRGSGRAPEGFSLHGALEECAGYLHHFGGHDAAVGCGVEQHQLDAFRNAFTEVTGRAHAVSASDERTPVVADDFLPLTEVTLETLEWILRFSPHGRENDPLRFFIGPVVLTRLTPVGDGSHVRLRLQEGQAELDAIWFHAPDAIKSQSMIGSQFGLVVELEENLWQGKRSAQLRIAQGWQLAQPIARTRFASVYRHLRKSQAQHPLTLSDVAEDSEDGVVQVILDTFLELGFARCDDGAYHMVESSRARDLRESIAYQSHLRAQFVELKGETSC